MSKGHFRKKPRHTLEKLRHRLTDTQKIRRRKKIQQRRITVDDKST